MKPLQNLHEVLKSLKHRKPTQIFCPRCCSPKIKMYSTFDLWLTPPKYVCQNCGYIGPVILELEKEDNENEQTPNPAALNSTVSSKSYTDSAP